MRSPFAALAGILMMAVLGVTQFAAAQAVAPPTIGRVTLQPEPA